MTYDQSPQVQPTEYPPTLRELVAENPAGCVIPLFVGGAVLTITGVIGNSLYQDYKARQQDLATNDTNASCISTVGNSLYEAIGTLMIESKKELPATTYSELNAKGLINQLRDFYYDEYGLHMSSVPANTVTTFCIEDDGDVFLKPSDLKK